MIELVPILAVTTNDDELVEGMAENTNVVPPFEDDIEIDAELLDETEKSEATAEVDPETFETLITQAIGVPTRCGDPKAQLRLEAIVGVP